MSLQTTRDDLNSKTGSRHTGVPKDADHIEAIQQTLLDPSAERALVWKCDLHVLPAITILFFLAFMDRTNIGV
jgi:hypothetical protein